MKIIAASLLLLSLSGCAWLDAVQSARSEISALDVKLNTLETKYKTGEISAVDFTSELSGVKSELDALAKKGGAASVIVLLALRFRHILFGYYDETDKKYKGFLVTIFKLAKNIIFKV